MVNIVTIKGEGCKLETLSGLATQTNGNVSIVNPENIGDDFSNILKD
jgi:sRNA-binding carbon storage regulator CsrA